MHAAILALALVANDYQPQRTTYPQAERVATASVHIIAAEIIDFDKVSPSTNRQFRVRDGMPMIEFY